MGFSDEVLQLDGVLPKRALFLDGSAVDLILFE